MPDPDKRTQHEVDVAVFAPSIPGERRRLLALGEAKWGERMDTWKLARLAHIWELLAARGFDTSATRLACYSAAGFTGELRAAARNERGLLVGLEEMYG